MPQPARTGGERPELGRGELVREELVRVELVRVGLVREELGRAESGRAGLLGSLPLRSASLGLSRAGLGRTYRRTRALALAFALLGAPGSAEANPDVGEQRSLLRDLDHPTTVIAGEADGAATVMNPANLGFLRGLSGVLEGSIASFGSGRRGSGVGAFLGIPLGLKALGLGNLAALGVGYQALFPRQLDVFNLQPGYSLGDARFHKVSFALAVPLVRWVPGLSFGLGYSRLLSRSNPQAAGVDQLDLSILYRAHERVALGLVARGVNMPTLAGGAPWDVHPVELDPEIAVRPLGIANVEVAAGGRIIPLRHSGARAWAAPWQPRARARFAVGPVGFFSEVELLRYGVLGSGGSVDYERGVRWLSGLSVDLRHVGIAGGPAGGRGSLDGGAARLRLSLERYDDVARLRPREVLRLRLKDYRGDRKMLELIDLVEAQPSDAVVLVETRGMGFGWAQTEEVREALERLRARGGKVVAFMEGGSVGSYYLASVADRIVAHPHARLALVGISSEVFYYGELLAKLGARGEFLRIAEYKARPETYERRGATAPVAAQRQRFYQDLYETVLGSIAAGRQRSVQGIRGWVDAAPLAPEEARTRGLVDALAYADEVDANVEAWLGWPVTIRTAKRRPEHDAALGRGPEIGVVHVEGVLRRGQSFKVPLVGQRIAGSETLTQAIDKLRKDPRIRAVVVRIDSIGGSVAAAAAITRALERTAEVKPVIVSFGNVAASGGYYVATAGSVIFTDALTSTGSIGVFRAKVDLSGVFAKLGVGVDRVSFGAAAGIGSWTKPYNDAERAAAMAGIEGSYALFRERVGAARGLSPEAVDGIARGRIWRGVRALQIGLADHDGGLYDAITHARGLVGRSGVRAEVVHVPAKPGVRAQLAAAGSVRSPFSALFGVEGGVMGDAELVLLGPLMPVLRRLPINLWLDPGEGEGEMAMMPEVHVESI